MPILPPNTAPYDSLESALNIARMRVNDMLVSVGGAAFQDNSVFTYTVIQAAWRRMQEFLASTEFRRNEQEIVLTSCPAINSTVANDPGSQQFINWTAYNDGVVYTPTPVLPANLIFPLRIWERPTNADTPQPFVPMELVVDGIFSQAKQARNYNWEWREDSIYLPGSTVPMDLKIRYAGFLQDFQPLSIVPYALQPIPIMRCLSAFAWYLVVEFTRARGDMEAGDSETKAQAEATLLAQKDTQIELQRSQWTIPDIPAATGATNQDSVSTIVNAVRVRLNSAVKNSGDIVVVNQTFFQQCFNNGWRRFQEFLWNLGYLQVTDEVIIPSIPVVTSTDPAVQQYINCTGFFDGTTLQVAPVLPQNFVTPLKVWERWTGFNGYFGLMDCWADGMPSTVKQTRNRIWEWRAGNIYFPGSTMVEDLRIRYGLYLADFIAVGAVPWYLQTVPIPRCLNALSGYVCCEVANARPDLNLDPLVFQTAAEGEARLVFNRDVRLKERTTIRRLPRSHRRGGGHGGSSWGLGGY